MPEMQYYIYNGVKDGARCRGKIQAETPEEAKERLARMGIDRVTFGDGEVPPPPPRTKADFWSGPLPPAPSQDAPVATAQPAPLPPPPAPSDGFSEASKTAVMKNIEVMSKFQPPPKEEFALRRRRQAFLVGDPFLLKEDVDKYLSMQNGVVVHLVMSPDLQGKLKVAMVIEHDI